MKYCWGTRTLWRPRISLMSNRLLSRPKWKFEETSEVDAYHSLTHSHAPLSPVSEWQKFPYCQNVSLASLEKRRQLHHHCDVNSGWSMGCRNSTGALIHLGHRSSRFFQNRDKTPEQKKWEPLKKKVQNRKTSIKLFINHNSTKLERTQGSEKGLINQWWSLQNNFLKENPFLLKSAQTKCYLRKHLSRDDTWQTPAPKSRKKMLWNRSLLLSTQTTAAWCTLSNLRVKCSEEK